MTDDDLKKKLHVLWRTNTSLLYDLVVDHVLEWPSITVDTHPKTRENGHHTCLIGTHTSNSEKNRLLLYDVNIPNEEISADDRIYDMHTDYGGFTINSENSIFHIFGTMNSDTEANRARFSPHYPHIVASIGTHGDAYLYDTRLAVPDGSVETRVAKLEAHTAEGWGLCFSSDDVSSTMYIVTAADDLRVCVWDINSYGTSRKPKSVTSNIVPMNTYLNHERSPQDISWVSKSPNSFATVGDDGKLIHYDLRCQYPTAIDVLSPKALNCVSYSPSQCHLLSTAGVDSDVTLWDSRQMREPLHKLYGHGDSVTSLRFHPLVEDGVFSSSMLASAGEDNKIIVWDLRRIGQEQLAEDIEDGPPELLFCHTGHMDNISDLSWSKDSFWDMTIASVSSDNHLQIWQLAKSMFFNNDDAECDEEDGYFYALG